MKTRIFLKYLWLLSAVTLLPLWFAGYGIMKSGQAGVKTALMELQMARAGAAAEVVSAGADAFLERTTVLGKKLSGVDWQSKMQVFTTFMELNPAVRSVSVISLEGQEIIRVLPSGSSGDSKLVSYSGSGDFASAKDRREGERIFLSAEGDSMVCYRPFGGKFLLRAEAGLEKVFAALGEDVDASGAVLLLADSHGKLVIPAPRGAATAAMQDWPVVRQALKNRLGTGALEFTASDTAMLGAYTPLRGARGAVIIAQPLKEAYQRVLFSGRRAALLLSITMLLVFAALCVISWRLAGRLEGRG